MRSTTRLVSTRWIAIIAVAAGLFAAFELSSRAYLFGLAGLSPSRINTLGLLHQPRYTRMSSEPRIGFELKPNLDDYFKLVPFRTNTRGLRDREVSLEKPAKTFRAAVVGASFALPSGVAIEHAFHSRLEEQLSSELAPVRYEFVNFAVGMHGPEQTLAMLELRALEYDPDLILFTATSLSAPGLMRVPTSLPPPRPFEPRTIPFLRSFFLRLVTARMGPGPGFPSTRVGFVERGFIDAFEPRSVAPGSATSAGAEDRQSGDRRTRTAADEPRTSVLARLADITQRSAIPIVVIRLAVRWEAPFGDRKLEAQSRQLGVYYHDTRKAFEGTRARDFWIHRVDMHPNAAAQERFARSIGAFLREQGLLTRGERGDRSPKRLGLIGDSITAGNVAPNGKGGRPYAEILEAELGDAWAVTNYAVGGTSVLDWAPGGSLFSGVQAEDVVSILIGSADAIFAARKPAAYGAYLKALVLALLQRGVGQVILVAPPPHPGSSDRSNRLNRLLVQYGVMIRTLCVAPPVHCGPDLFRELTPLESYFVNPGVGLESDPHPSAAGHRRIAERVALSVRKVAGE